MGKHKPGDPVRTAFAISEINSASKAMLARLGGEVLLSEQELDDNVDRRVKVSYERDGLDIRLEFIEGVAPEKPEYL